MVPGEDPGNNGGVEQRQVGARNAGTAEERRELVGGFAGDAQDVVEGDLVGSRGAVRRSAGGGGVEGKEGQTAQHVARLACAVVFGSGVGEGRVGRVRRRLGREQVAVQVIEVGPVAIVEGAEGGQRLGRGGEGVKGEGKGTGWVGGAGVEVRAGVGVRVGVGVGVEVSNHVCVGVAWRGVPRLTARGVGFARCGPH